MSNLSLASTGLWKKRVDGEHRCQEPNPMLNPSSLEAEVELSARSATLKVEILVPTALRS